jgi:hypothetical protein
VAILVALTAESSAHRLDEYLQAARLSLTPEQISLEIDLTPGASLAADVVALLDRDDDGAISTHEAGAYGQRVLDDTVMEIDGHRVVMTLTRVEMPTIGEMHDGLGTIRLEAVGRPRGSPRGRRVVYFRNNHQPGWSVYLVNALVPVDRPAAAVRQDRDPRQREVRVTYDAGSARPVQIAWMGIGAAALLTLVVRRRAAARAGLSARQARQEQPTSGSNVG